MVAADADRRDPPESQTQPSAARVWTFPSRHFTFIGILLYVYYQQDPTFKPAANADIFGSYILNVLPTGVRGLVLAGVFATAMDRCPLP
jgi:Na+/proline symporter